MANTWIEPPPPQRGMGCFAKGCITVLVFALVLAAACSVGLYWGFRHHSALLRGGYWLSKTQALSDQPIDVPTHEASQPEIQTAKERWQNFEDAVEDHQPAEIELSADDINNLVASSRHLHGKLFVSVEGNRLRVRASIPLREYVPRYGYYFNADVAIQTDEELSVDHPRLNAVTINGRQVPSDFLNWEYKSRNLRSYLSEYGDKSNTGSIAIREGKVILRSRPR
jgi:hypothetical protein